MNDFDDGVRNRDTNAMYGAGNSDAANGAR